MIRLLVTGWRHANLTNHGAIIVGALALAVASHRLRLDQMLLPHWRQNPGDDVLLVHGACNGVDAIAELTARRWGWKTEQHPAVGHPTQKFGPWPQAGPARNRYMVALGADVVAGLPGPGSRGTIQCIGMAISAGLIVQVTPIRPVPRREEDGLGA